MYISKIIIRNFRIFDNKGITIFFNKGINAIISENNCGKTAIIDAIRIAFSTVPYKKDIYFNLSDFHVQNNGQRCNEAYISIYFNEVSHDCFELWDPENPTNGEFHIRYYTVNSSDGKEKVKYSIWGGPVEGNSISSEIFDSMQLVSLGALRNAETEMRPSRTSKLASLLRTTADSNEAKEDIINILRKANQEILIKNPIIRIRQIVNENLSTIEQDILKQRVELGLVEPRFDSIAAALRAWIKPRWIFLENKSDSYLLLKEAYTNEEWKKHTTSSENGAFVDITALKELNKKIDQNVSNLLDRLSNNNFELFQNGLGYNNILFMSAVLGDMKASGESTLFNLLLVEEPEAHLHPQLQELIYNFFENSTSNEANLQIIFTTHSPSLVSRIEIDKISLLYELKHRINCLSLSQSNIDETDRKNLERYLDVTKSQMLFAKGILFVEGISEAMLLPIFAEYLNLSLTKYAVEIVNIDGVSFKPFANLLCYANNTNETTLHAAIITDDDRCTDKKDANAYINKEIDYDTKDISSVVDKLKSPIPSERFRAINNLCNSSHIKIFGARKTLEYELALYPGNIPYILDAIKESHPISGDLLANTINNLNSNEEKAACLWLFIRDRVKYKGEIAQNLARKLKKDLQMIKESPLKNRSHNSFVIPEYLKNAIIYVTNNER